MEQITLKNFRCFREEQTARLAPLTLLVGENSTGKTSFLAMIRALWDVAHRSRIPDFKEEPYDLGSFDEIAHSRGNKQVQSGTFEAGIDSKAWFPAPGAKRNESGYLKVTFAESGTAPVPVCRRIRLGEAWLEECFEAGQLHRASLGNGRGTWNLENLMYSYPRSSIEGHLPPPFGFPVATVSVNEGHEEFPDFEPLLDSPEFVREDLNEMLTIRISLSMSMGNRLFASAPVRSRPRRTYDPSRPTPDPEGDYVPMYLAETVSQNKQTWADLKERLEDFGKASGLFDEITVKRLGKRGSEPFQMQIRKSSGRLKGPWRNLIDVGYGVSQALPILTELLREDPPSLFLLQQPEVHLHPSAQAALGSLFCEGASSGRQIIVETHSDHLMDRVRMDVRDGDTPIKPEDVSILFFERDGLEVNIHSLRIDEEGNIVGAPDGYRSFFMEETTRSLSL